MAKPTESDPIETPFGLSWQAIYGLVLGVLAVQILVYAALTAIYQ
jgi:hypothetical protein